MAVKCASCGEELMGAVNRCWRCGHEFIPQSGSPALPPVRQVPTPTAPQAVPPGNTADVPPAASPSENIAFVQPQPSQSVSMETPGEAQGESPSAMPTPPPGYDRVGSPFAAPGDAAYPQLPTATSVPTAVEMPVYPRHAAATGGAIASLVMGVLSALGVLLLLSGVFFTAIGTLLTSVLGIGLGIWGTYSQRRGYAIAGLLLCCLTLCISGFFCTQELYVALYGRSPWAMDPAEELMEDGP